MKAETITREVDELIWQVAESGDAKMYADFLQRYPQHAAILEARKKLVFNMRSAKPVAPVATHFAPTRRAARPRYWLAPLAAGLLVGLAMASYQVVKYRQSAPSEPHTTIVVNPQSPVPTPRDGREMRSIPTGEQDPGIGVRPIDETYEDSLVTITVEGATLFGALAAIQGTGLKIEIMPGLEDAPITLAPNRDDGTLALAPLAMLETIRAAAGFELINAGPDGYLALPRDKTKIIGGKEARSVEVGTDRN